MALQEINGWRHSDTHSALYVQLLTGYGRAGLFVPKDCAQSIGESIIRDDAVGAVVGNMGFISAYLPDCGKRDEAYLAAVTDLIDLAKQIVRKGATCLCLMGDLQTELPAYVLDVTGGCVGSEQAVNT